MMELPSFEEITTARPISFKVGPNKREFFVHSALVGGLSPTLNRLVTGPWSESAAGVVDWEHVSEATFVHFCQYAYRGSFHIPSTPKTRVNLDATAELPFAGDPPQTGIEEVVAKTSEEESTDDMCYLNWTGPVYPRSRSSKQGYKKIMREHRSQQERFAVFSDHFQSVFRDQLRNKRPSKKALATVEVGSSAVTECSSYGEIFLAHANLYVFADYHQIDKLAAQALRKLHDSLMAAPAKDSDVVQILEFCVNTDIPDALREIMLAYVATKASQLWADEEFQKLLQQDSEMSVELLDLIMKATRV